LLFSSRVFLLPSKSIEKGRGRKKLISVQKNSLRNPFLLQNQKNLLSFLVFTFGQLLAFTKFFKIVISKNIQGEINFCPDLCKPGGSWEQFKSRRFLSEGNKD